DQSTERHSEQRDPQLDRRRKRRVRAQQQSREKSGADPDSPSDDALNQRFGEKLPQDIALRRSDSAPNADFPRSFRHAHQHYVHDHDSADYSGDGTDHDEHREERSADALPELDVTLGRSDVEAIVLSR